MVQLVALAKKVADYMPKKPIHEQVPSLIANQKPLPCFLGIILGCGIIFPLLGRYSMFAYFMR